MKKIKIIWRFSDGKLGHDKQSIALIKNIKNCTNCRVFDINVKSFKDAFLGIFFKKYKIATGIPKPDIAIGAGHKTHFHLLATKRCFKAKIIVIMKPSLPTKLFDLCVIPKHDEFKDSSNIITTHTPMVSINSKIKKKENIGLFLIGGPSKHYYWNTKLVLDQVKEISKKFKCSKFFLTTSRRTPINFINDLDNLKLKNIKGYEYTKIESNWLDKHIGKVKNIWVTNDSYSMIIEAIASGANTDIIDLKIKKNTKLSGEISMIKQNIRKKIPIQNEAKRVAKFIQKKWL